MPDDRESDPGTQPFVPDFDTGEQPPAGGEPSVPHADTGPGTHPFVPDFDTGRHSRPESESSDFDTGAHSRPLTEPFVPDFDTGRHSRPPTEPFVPDFDTGEDSLAFPEVPGDESAPEPSPLEEQPAGSSSAAQTEADSEVAQPLVQSVTVPGRYYYLKWWKLALVVVGVWIVAAPIGPGLFYWWTQDRSLHKTPVVFVVLIYVVVCTVAGVMLAMVEGGPLISALAVAVMSAPFASVAATAPFYGAFYCSHTTDACFIGIIPF